MGSSDGGGGGDSRNEVRYAEIVENSYARFMLGNLRENEFAHDGVWLTLYHTYAHTDAIYSASPLAGYEKIDVEDGFGPVTATRVHSMQLPQPFRLGAIEDPELVAFSHAESTQIWHALETSLWQQYQSDLWLENAVQSSTFVVARSLVGQRFVSVLHEMMHTVRIASFELMVRLWHRWVQWEQDITWAYQVAVAGKYMWVKEYEAQNMQMQVDDRVWNFQVMLGVRAQVGALSTDATVPEVRPEPPKGPSLALELTQMAITGASIGATVAPKPYAWAGAIVGALKGIEFGLARRFLF